MTLEFMDDHDQGIKEIKDGLDGSPYVRAEGLALIFCRDATP